MKNLAEKLFASNAPSQAALIRLMVGAVFFFEGIQKFVYADDRGAGRFAKIGLPIPEVLGPVVGFFELSCGALVLLGLFTRLAVLPLITTMLVAIVTTKLPILLGEAYWGLHLRELPRYTFLEFAHEARTDASMLLASIFLLSIGSDRLTLDAWFDRRRRA